MDNSFSPVPKRMMRPGTTCACHDSSIPHIYGYLKHNQSIRPHPDHAVGSTLSISMPDPPCFMVPPLPRFVCMHAPSPSSTPITLPIRSSPSSTPPRSFIHHFIGIHSTVHSSRDKHHADPCCPPHQSTPIRPKHQHQHQTPLSTPSPPAPPTSKTKTAFPHTCAGTPFT